MKKIFNYHEFKLNESVKNVVEITDEFGNIIHPPDFKKVQILSNKTETEYEETDGASYKDLAIKTIYKLINTGNLDEYDPNMPSLNWMDIDLLKNLIKENKLNPNTIYNLPEL